MKKLLAIFLMCASFAVGAETKCFSPGAVTVDTGGIYASGDVLFVPVRIEDFFARRGGGYSSVSLLSVSMTNKNDEAFAMDLVFYSSSVSMGAANAAMAISDANQESRITSVTVAAASWQDDVNSYRADLAGSDVVRGLMAGGDDIWVGGVSRGTPDFSGGAATDLYINNICIVY